MVPPGLDSSVLTNWWRVLLAFTLVTGPAVVTAQDLRAAPTVRFEHITDADGLSQNSINSILQDHRGLMWFGTLDGLNRYDGYTFTVFKHDALDPASLADNYILSLWEDHEGTVWVGTAGGLDRFDRDTDGFEHYVHGLDDPVSFAGLNVYSIYEDHGGALWLGTDDGLYLLHRDTGRIEHYTHDTEDSETLAGRDALAICEDSAGRLWVGSTAGLSQLDRRTGKFTRYMHDPLDPASLGSPDVRSIVEDGAGILWVGTVNGLNRWDAEGGAFKRYSHDPLDPHGLAHDKIESLTVDRFGSLWVSTRSGLQLYDRDSDRFTTYRHDPGDPTSLSNSEITPVYEDRTGTLWVGTWSAGVNRLVRGQKFQHFFLEPGDPNTLSNNVVKSFQEDRTGAVWVGTVSGLNRFDPQTRRMTRYLHDSTDPSSLSHNDIWSLHEDRAGTLWVGTNGGLNRYDRTNDAFTRLDLETPPDAATRDGVAAIYEDHVGTLWLGTLGGLVEMRRDGTKLRYVHEAGDATSLSHNVVLAIVEDANHELWLGTQGGLNRFDREKAAFTRYMADPGNPESLSNNQITAIAELHDGETRRLWIGTWSGLNELDRETGRFERYTVADGLPNDFICGILGDSSGQLWLSTNRGLSRFDPRTGSFRNYDVADGLQANEFNYIAYTQARSGEMYFGGVNGFNVFHPDDITDNPHVPEIVFTDFQIFNQHVSISETGSPLEKPISETEAITLSYADSVFSFEFAAIDYTAPDKNQFAYMMEGFDPDWNYVGTRHYATYTNLDPGNYVFRVKGSNNDGVWNEEGRAIAVVIQPPPWRTWWAYTIYATLFLAALYGIRTYELHRFDLRNRLEMEQLKSEKLRELDHAKSRFFANISHELRTPLTLIDGPVKRMLSQTTEKGAKHDLELVSRNARRLSDLITQLLDLSRLEAGKLEIEARPGNFIALVNAIVMTFASLAENKGVSLSFRDTGSRSHTSYFDPDVIEKIFVNLLSNAIKFTPRGGRITVEARQLSSDDSVEVRVSDTGIGIARERLARIFDRFYQVDGASTREHEGTGIGLSLAKELTEAHHGTINVESTEGEGTSFVVALALGRQAFAPDEILDEGEGVESAPRRDMHVDAPRVNDSPRPSEPLTNDDTIVLVVEDNPDMRGFIRQTLEPEYRVIEARDGREGLDKAIDTIPDLVVSDVMMPKMDGYQLCSELKNDERSSHVPVILLTAKASRDEKIEGLQTGADDYLVKPFDSEELRARVRNLIVLRKKLRERFSRTVVLKPSEVAVTSVDETFLTKVLAVVEEHIEDEDFGVEVLGRKVGMSRSQVHRKLRALTNQSPSRFIRSVRLHRAAELLKHKAGSVAEIAYMVGFSSQSYFTKCFHEQFGCTPKEYGREASREPAF